MEKPVQSRTEVRSTTFRLRNGLVNSYAIYQDQQYRIECGFADPKPASLSPKYDQPLLWSHGGFYDPAQDDISTPAELSPPSFLEAACKGAEFFIDDENYARMRKGKIPLKRRE